MNNFLESFLLVFVKNKWINLRRYWKTFCHKADPVPTNKITVLTSMAIKLW